MRKRFRPSEVAIAGSASTVYQPISEAARSWPGATRKSILLGLVNAQYLVHLSTIRAAGATDVVENRIRGILIGDRQTQSFAMVSTDVLNNPHNRYAMVACSLETTPTIIESPTVPEGQEKEDSG